MTWLRFLDLFAGFLEVAIVLGSIGALGLVAASVILDIRRETSESSCRVCGCTEDRACPGGCYWADVDHTLCSECVGAPRQAGREGAFR